MSKFQWEMISWFMRIMLEHVVLSQGTSDWIEIEAEKWHRRLAEEE